MTHLIPVSEWIWSLYKVQYLTEENGTVLATRYYVADMGERVLSEDECYAPSDCKYITWDNVKKGVAPPRAIGQIYGHPIDESWFTTGERLAKELKLI